MANNGRSQEGNKFREECLTKLFKNVILELSEFEDSGEVHFHTLQHTYMSQLVMKSIEREQLWIWQDTRE